MLTEQEIKQALHASRVAPMPMAVPHGPFGWEHLSQFLGGRLDMSKVVKSLEIPAETWQKLEKIADEASRIQSRPVSVSDVAAAILRQYAESY